MIAETTLHSFLDEKVALYNHPSFIQHDPVCIPHLFTTKADQEIAGFFAALFAWGNRKTIIAKARELMQLMDNQPYAFCKNHSPNDLKLLLHFKHRTFQITDLLYCIRFLQQHYQSSASLETAFFPGSIKKNEQSVVEKGLNHFNRYFFSLADAPQRTRKHIASPEKGSTCKRLNMYLRWMVRNDRKGVDFGIWKKVSPAHLICPVDVHVTRVAKRFNLLQRKQIDWLAALELTETLRRLDPLDPVKYDFALFGLGVMEKF
ncbi:MAG TPA: TIGR02757 family protein [Sediminibacterium sp.]|nr:TIGR02757 family protein [Sediminibacterium sp.]